MLNPRTLTLSQRSHTFTSSLELIEEVSRSLHQIARQARQHRRVLVGGERFRKPPDLPPELRYSRPPDPVDRFRQVICKYELWRGASAELSCEIRATWNYGSQPAVVRPGQTPKDSSPSPPFLLVDFAPRDGTGPERTLTIQVNLADGRRTAGPFSKRRLVGLSRQEREDFRHYYLKGLRRFEIDRLRSSDDRDRPWEQWSIMPRLGKVEERGHEQATHFALLLFLWRGGLIDDPIPPLGWWPLAKAFIEGRNRHSIQDAEVFEVLTRLRDHYAWPEHWKQLRKYVARVYSDVRFKPPRHGVPVAPEVAEALNWRRAWGEPRRRERRTHTASPLPSSIEQVAESSGVRPETVYRWIRAGKLEAKRLHGRLRLNETEQARAKNLAKPRRIRKLLMETLVEQRGKTPEAAKKWIQRRLGIGKTFAEIVRELQARRSP